jgi:hypothetical protein
LSTIKRSDKQTDKQVDKQAAKLAEKQLADKPLPEKQAEKSADKSTDKHIEKSFEKPEKAADKTARHAEKGADKVADKAIEKSAEKAEKPEAAEKPAEKAEKAEKPAKAAKLAPPPSADDDDEDDDFEPEARADRPASAGRQSGKPGGNAAQGANLAGNQPGGHRMEESRYFELDTRLETLRQRRAGEDPRVLEAFHEKLDIGWIYHDNALEGVVLSYHEIKDALDRKIISDVSLVSLYEDIRNHKAAIDFIKELGQTQASQRKKHGLITVELIKQLHEILTPEDKSKGSPYRKDNPLHRAYYHEISTPDKIPLRMRKLCEWLDDEETDAMHPLQRAAGIHFRLMAIYPWTKNSGKVARLLMNLLLIRDGYPPAVLHSIERQRYYDSLRAENGYLAGLVTEALNTYAATYTRFLDELAEVRRSREAS